LTRNGHRRRRPKVASKIAPSAEDKTNHIYTGVVSHITAASPGGPRYDGTLSPEESSSDLSLFFEGTERFAAQL
jgi:hypothetical protein